MSKSQNQTAASFRALPADAREALQWFINTYGLYVGSTRGLFITEWAEEREATLEAAIINLKSRGFSPFPVTGETLFKQADYLWKESRTNTQFGPPLASKLELELVGSDIVILDNLEAPENSRQLWYLYSHLLYPRAVAGKATIITTPLSFQEFARYGNDCNDPDFCGKAINWEKLVWLIEASMVTLDVLKLAHAEGLPPMLKAEHGLYTALKERGLDVVPQHVLGDFILDFALIDKERRLNIECDTVSSLGSSELQRQEAKRNLMLFSDGWQVLKFTTGEIIGNKAGCVDVVDDVWRSGRKRGSTGRLLTGNVVPPLPELPVDDDVQVSAITYGGGPAAICGGAGTGKTTCIVQRVSYLIGQGISPENILVLTHATDTQRALKRLIEAATDKQVVQRLSVCSWQDLGLKILKENLPAIKRKPPLKIEPSPQKIVQRLLAKIKKESDPTKVELSLDLDEFYVAAVISMYKAHLITPQQAKAEAGTYSEEVVARIFQQLEDQLQKANRIDRDDVTAMSVQVLLENPELRARYQRQFEFVLIDEYQDVTVGQEMLGRLLAAPQDNLYVAGDEDSTVCEARNSCPELFTELSLRMPQARCFILERNWRSHPAIVDHARQMCCGLQKKRIHREYVSAWGQAPTSAVVGPNALADEFDEANWVASEIQLLVDSGRSYGDIAILFRHHVYATILEEALDRKGVHFQSSNPISNFIPDEIEDMLAFLKLVVDPDGPRARESFERVCQLRIKEIDPKLSGTIASFAEANNLSYLKAVEIYSEATADQACRDLEQLVRVIRTMHQEKLPPTEAIALIRRTQRLNEYYKTVKVPAGVNYEPLKKLTLLEEESRNFKTIAELIKSVAGQRQSATGVADAGVQVLPILDSKGLEFPIVFLVGMSEGIFPAQNAVDLEEERRICYVGLTRAKELLYVSYPQMFSGAMLQASQFLLESRLLAALPPIQYQHVPVPQPESQSYVPPQVAYQPEPAPYVPPQVAYQPEPVPYVPPQVAYQPEPVPYAPPQVAYQPEPVPYVPPQVAYQPEPAPYVPPQVAYQPEPAAYVPPQAVPQAESAFYAQPKLSVPESAAHVQPEAPQPAEATSYVEPQPAHDPGSYLTQRAQQQEPAPYISSEAAHQPDAATYVQPPAEQAPYLAPPPPQQVEPLAQIMSAPPADSNKPQAAKSSTFNQDAAAVSKSQEPDTADPFHVYTAEPPAPTRVRQSLPKSKAAAAAAARQAAQGPPTEAPGVPAPVGIDSKAGAAGLPPAYQAAPPLPPILPAAHDVPALGYAAALAEQGAAQQQAFVQSPQAPAQQQAFVQPQQAPAQQQAFVQPQQAPAQQQAFVQPQQAPAQQQAFVQPQQAPAQQQAFVQPQQAPAQQQAFVQSQQAPAQQQAFVQPSQAPVQQQAAALQQAPVHQGNMQTYQVNIPDPIERVVHAPLAYPYGQNPPPVPHEHIDPADTGGRPICPSCYAPLEANARFCSECGYSLPERIPACPTCSAPLEVTAKFCGECGVPLNAPLAGDSSQVSQNMMRMKDLKDKQAGWVNKVWKMLES